MPFTSTTFSPPPLRPSEAPKAPGHPPRSRACASKRALASRFQVHLSTNSSTRFLASPKYEEDAVTLYPEIKQERGIEPPTPAWEGAEVTLSLLRFRRRF